MNDSPSLSSNWQTLKTDLARVAARDRWSRALLLIGWEHLAFSLVYQAFYRPGPRLDGRFTISLWVAEVVAVIVTMRLVSGKGWHRSTPLAGVIVRVWATFLILSFNLASLNGLTGFGVDWFKLVWCTLGSFGFATMAWLLTPWFLIPAFQMYFTGLLMAHYPSLAYVIHGTSWCLALQAIGLILERRRCALTR